MLGAWLLTMLSPIFGRRNRAKRVLSELLASLEASTASDFDLPGRRERLLINTAFLLLTSPEATDPTEPDETGCQPIPYERGALLALICKLDPGSAMAQAAFLADGETPARS